MHSARSHARAHAARTRLARLTYALLARAGAPDHDDDDNAGDVSRDGGRRTECVYGSPPAGTRERTLCRATRLPSAETRSTHPPLPCAQSTFAMVTRATSRARAAIATLGVFRGMPTDVLVLVLLHLCPKDLLSFSLASQGSYYAAAIVLTRLQGGMILGQVDSIAWWCVHGDFSLSMAFELLLFKGVGDDAIVHCFELLTPAMPERYEREVAAIQYAARHKRGTSLEAAMALLLHYGPHEAQSVPHEARTRLPRYRGNLAVSHFLYDLARGPDESIATVASTT